MNNLTPRAQQALAFARKEADRFNHDCIGTKHLILGLLHLPGCAALKAFAEIKVNLVEVRIQIENQMGTALDQGRRSPVPYTPTIKKVIALAGKEARLLEHQYVGTAHLLLGIIHEEENFVAKVLKIFGVTLENTRRVIKEMITESVDTEACLTDSRLANIAKDKLAELRTDPELAEGCTIMIAGQIVNCSPEFVACLIACKVHEPGLSEILFPALLENLMANPSA